MKIENLKFNLATMGLVAVMAAAAPATTVHAEENAPAVGDVLYEEENDNYTTTPIGNDIPDATNYEQEPPVTEVKPAIDPAANNGDCIDSDNYEPTDKPIGDVPTERERKHIPDEPTPTPDKPTPTPDQPTPTPTPDQPSNPTPGTPVVPTVKVDKPIPKTGEKDYSWLEMLAAAVVAGGATYGGFTVYSGKKKKASELVEEEPVRVK